MRGRTVQDGVLMVYGRVARTEARRARSRVGMGIDTVRYCCVVSERKRQWAETRDDGGTTDLATERGKSSGDMEIR